METWKNLSICWCCNRHYTELKRFKGPGDPLESDYVEPYKLQASRASGPYDEEAEKAVEEAYKCCGNDPYAVDQWLINKHGREKTEQILCAIWAHSQSEKTWECHDGIGLNTDLYYHRNYYLNSPYVNVGP